MRVVHGAVHLAPGQFRRGVAEYALGRRVDEGGDAGGVEAVNALADGVQQQLIFAFKLLKHAGDAVPVADAGQIVALGIGMGAQVLQLLGILQAEMQPRPGAVLLKAAVDLNPNVVLGGLQDQRVAPGPALLDELLAKHDQRRQVGREQPAGRAAAYLGRRLAQQTGALLIGADHPVGIGVNHQLGAGGLIKIAVKRHGGFSLRHLL